MRASYGVQGIFRIPHWLRYAVTKGRKCNRFVSK